MCYPFNILCRLPVLYIPSVLASINVPTGMQIVEKPYEDIAVFQASYNLEQLKPWYESAKYKPNL